MALALTVALTVALCQAHADTLPGTVPLEFDGELDVRIMDGAHAFVDRKISEAARSTARLPLGEGRDEAIVSSRAALARKLGVIDERPAVRLETFAHFPSGPFAPPAGLVAEGPGFAVHQVRWTVLPGLVAEGLLVEPSAMDTGVANPLSINAPAMVYLPDAGETPEEALGIGSSSFPETLLALRFASTGFRMLIPAVLRCDINVGEPESNLAKTDQSQREWIWRQAYQMGRHPTGYEIQTALAAVDWLDSGFAESVTVAGYGEGGRTALYAAALDTRIDHAFVSGAFGPRGIAWNEPIYRNIFDLLDGHGDAEVAALISPRVLMVEHSEFPNGADRKGRITNDSFESIETEFKRIAEALNAFATPPGFLLHEATGKNRGDYPAVAAFLQTADIQREVSRIPPIALLIDQRPDSNPDARQQRILEGTQAHVQSLVDSAETRRRDAYFHAAEPGLVPGNWSTERRHELLDPSGFIEFSDEMREKFHEEIIGRFDEELAAPNPRSRLLAETDAWTAWDVVLDVYDGFETWGILVLPKDIAPDEKRPVVVCVHGRNGLPRDTLDAGKSAYNDFAARLAEEGYVVFAPHHLYRGEDRYRWLDRKANQVGATLFTFLVDSHRQILPWLKGLPQVDGERIAFYGLSYGGESAMRIPAVLTDYSMSICSGDFNHWTRKVADPDAPASFMNSIEWEMPYWNMGNTFDYSELAGLIFPRPFFVERGHHDRVALDGSVAYEYAEVRRLYALFGMPERTGIEYFPGGHSINLEGSREFLKKHLGDPRSW